MAYWAVVFLVLTFPLGIVVTWNDLKYLKIPNMLVLFLLAEFLIVGPMVLPFEEYIRSLLYGLIALLVGILIHATGLIPAGDLKYTAVLIPFVDTGDLLSFLLYTSLAALTAVFTHVLFGRFGLAPDGWESWNGRGWKRRFPFGFALTGGLFIYLSIQIIRSV